MKKELLRFLIVNHIQSWGQQRQRKFLIDCIKGSGYLKEKVETEIESEFKEYYEERERERVNKDSESESEETYFEPSQTFAQSFQEQQQSSMAGPFAGRTMIDTTSERLLELQRRGIEQEEVDYNQVRDQVTEALSQVFVKYPDLNIKAVLDYAMGMYQQIKKALDEGLITGKKGKYRKGYIFLILYYALINFQICLQKEELVNYFNNAIRISDLPAAEKNLSKIFGDKLEIKTNSVCLKVADLKQRQEIDIVLNKLKKRFSEPPTSAEIAAAVRYITGKSYKELEQSFQIRDETIRKKVLVIESVLGKK